MSDGFQPVRQALAGGGLRTAAVLVGFLLVGLAVGCAWNRRLKILPAFFLVCGGLALGAAGLFPGLLRWVNGLAYMTRIRWFMGLVSAMVLAVTIEAIRRSRLRERYALLWVGTAGLVFVVAMVPGLLVGLSRWLGMQYVTVVVAAVFTFLLLVAFHFSIALSEQEEDKAGLAQRCALLEERIEQLERERTRK